MPLSVINIPPPSSPQAGTRESSPTNGIYTIQEAMKPFLICMKLTGLHHLRWSDSGSKKAGPKCALIYRGVIVCLLLVNFIFSLGPFFSDVSQFDAILLNNIISSIWFLQVALFSLNNVIRGTRWDKFYKAWDSFAEEFKIDTKDVCKGPCVVIVIAYIIWLLLASGFMGISLSVPRPPSGFMLHIPEEAAMFVLTLIIIAYFFFISSWFLLTSQFTFVTLSLCRLLWKLYGSIKKCLDQGTLCENIERLRQQHEQLCGMIDMADNVLCVFISAAVFSTIPLIVLTLYYVLFQSIETQPFNYFATWWSISLSTLQLCVVFFAGGALNYAVHRPANALYRIDLTKATPSSALQLTVFLNRLTSQPIGMTAVGLFYLDKPTIITFVGSIMTYAIVMIQFKPGDSTIGCLCNCTG